MTGRTAQMDDYTWTPRRCKRASRDTLYFFRAWLDAIRSHESRGEFRSNVCKSIRNIMDEQRSRRKRRRLARIKYPIESERFSFMHGKDFRCFLCSHQFGKDQPFVTTGIGHGCSGELCVVCTLALNLLLKYSGDREFAEGCFDFEKSSTNSFYKKCRRAVFTTFNSGGQEAYDELVGFVRTNRESEFVRRVELLSGSAAVRKSARMAQMRMSR